MEGGCTEGRESEEEGGRDEKGAGGWGGGGGGGGGVKGGRRRVQRKGGGMGGREERDGKGVRAKVPETGEREGRGKGEDKFGCGGVPAHDQILSADGLHAQSTHACCIAMGVIPLHKLRVNPNISFLCIYAVYQTLASTVKLIGGGGGGGGGATCSRENTSFPILITHPMALHFHLLSNEGFLCSIFPASNKYRFCRKDQ